MPYPQSLTGDRGRLNARVIKGKHHKGDFIDTERRVACRANLLRPGMIATISKTASFATVGGNSCGIWCWRSIAEHGSRGARGRQARPRPRPSPRHRLALVYAFQEQGSHATLKRALTEHWGGVLPALSSAPNFPIQCRKQKKNPVGDSQGTRGKDRNTKMGLCGHIRATLTYPLLSCKQIIP